MRCTCWTPAERAGVAPASGGGLRAGLLALALLACGSPGAAQTVVSCSLGNARLEMVGKQAVFQIEVGCNGAAGATRYPVGQPLVAGLTLYRWPARAPVAAAAEQTVGDVQTTMQEKPNPQKRPRRLLRDGDGPSYDLAPKEIAIAASSSLVLRFQVPAAETAGFDSWLFAVWPRDQMRRCDPADSYARSGCKRHGVVIGDDSATAPIDQYPGLESTEVEHPAGHWSSPRWLVERFR